MGRCRLCGRESALISRWIGVCAECLRTRPDAIKIVRARRMKWRIRIRLPPAPKNGGNGVSCRICVNQCQIPSGGEGYCGVWVNRGGRLTHRAGRDKVIAYTYLDPLPTNCVATPVCPGATGRGYPRYTDVRGPEYGFYNLAVFMGGCPLDCAFCQNWEHKAMVSPQAAQGLAMAGYHALTPLVSMDVEELVDKAMDDKVRCICYFGGDPTPQTPQLIRASRRILQQSQGIKRICWETDGLVNPALMKEMARASLESGGIVKIDWKAWTPEIYEALTGVDGYKAHERLKENTRIVAEMAGKRREPPLLVVSILLVPGYVGPGEVYKVSRYIASLNRETPLVLLAFHPQYLMQDLPPTSIDHMKKAIEQAERAGIKEVYIGNEWLLKDTYKVEDWWDPG